MFRVFTRVLTSWTEQINFGGDLAVTKKAMPPLPPFDVVSGPGNGGPAADWPGSAVPRAGRPDTPWHDLGDRTPTGASARVASSCQRGRAAARRAARYRYVP